MLGFKGSEIKDKVFSFLELQNHENNPYEYYLISKLQIKQDSAITLYVDIEYTCFTLSFQGNFSFNYTSGGPLWK